MSKATLQEIGSLIKSGQKIQVCVNPGSFDESWHNIESVTMENWNGIELVSAEIRGIASTVSDRAIGGKMYMYRVF